MATITTNMSLVKIEPINNNYKIPKAEDGIIVKVDIKPVIKMEPKIKDPEIIKEPDNKRVKTGSTVSGSIITLLKNPFCSVVNHQQAIPRVLPKKPYFFNRKKRNARRKRWFKIKKEMATQTKEEDVQQPAISLSAFQKACHDFLPADFAKHVANEAAVYIKSLIDEETIIEIKEIENEVVDLTTENV